MGKYDIPAQIDYTLNKTGQANLSYIAHSQGTTQMFAALAEGYGDLSEKVNIFIAMAPIAYMGNIPDEFFKTFSPGG